MTFISRMEADPLEDFKQHCKQRLNGGNTYTFYRPIRRGERAAITARAMHTVSSKRNFPTTMTIRY